MRVATLAIGLLALTGLVSGQSAPAPQSSLPSSFTRFLDNRVESLTQFRAVRHLEATNTRFKKQGRMDVITELSPPAEDGLVRLFIKPKRQERTLIDGTLLVREDDADLVKVTGRLAKNPSFWKRSAWTSFALTGASQAFACL
jgi:hypothetical protein